MATLRDLQDSLSTQEPPAVEPAAIQQQQVALQEIRHEIDQVHRQYYFFFSVFPTLSLYSVSPHPHPQILK
jgi:hypothetical protein